MKILLLDNYDSFTYNIYHYLQGLYSSVDVYRNDEISLDAVDSYSHIVISPGPGLPLNAGITMELLRLYSCNKKILGVCLGMQAIAEHFGGKLYNQQTVKHGLTTTISHSGKYLFCGIEQFAQVALYHSWAVDENSLPNTLIVEAKSAEGVVMAIRHRDWPVYGVQFHPESILTPQGYLMLKNWLQPAITI